ncbi:hypothetical protein [Streptomyces sp. NPDC002788]
MRGRVDEESAHTRTFVSRLVFMLLTVGVPPWPLGRPPQARDRHALTGPSPSSRAACFLHQGMDPAASGEHHRLPRRLALLTRSNPTC